MTRFDGSSPQQSVQFLPKRFCAVQDVEILTGYKLTASFIEKISFTVPRLHKNYFQDDLFPPTLDVEKPLQTAAEWFKKDVPAAKMILIDLQPAGMIPLSQKPTAVVERKVTQMAKEASESERKEAVTFIVSLIAI